MDVQSIRPTGRYTRKQQGLYTSCRCFPCGHLPSGLMTGPVKGRYRTITIGGELPTPSRIRRMNVCRFTSCIVRTCHPLDWMNKHTYPPWYSLFSDPVTGFLHRTDQRSGYGKINLMTGRTSLPLRYGLFSLVKSNGRSTFGAVYRPYDHRLYD